MNTRKEHLKSIEKEPNVKNIVFDLHQTFEPCQNCMDPRHPQHQSQNFDPRQSFKDPHHPQLPRHFKPHQTMNHATHQPMDPRYPRHPRYLTDFSLP